MSYIHSRDGCIGGERVFNALIMPKNKRETESTSPSEREPVYLVRATPSTSDSTEEAKKSATISAPHSRYERSVGGLLIEGNSTFDNVLKMIDLLGYWLCKLAPFIVLLFALPKFGLAAVPIVFGKSGWDWLRHRLGN